MKTLHRALVPALVAILLLAGCSSSSSTPDPKVVPVLEQTINGYLAALEAKDLNTAVSYLAEPDSRTKNGMSVFFNTFDSWAFDNVEITVLSQHKSKATAKVERDVTTTKEGQTTDEHMSETYKLVKIDGKWLIESASTSSPTSTPAGPTPTPMAALPQSPIPDDFTTYTSWENQFQIAYPSEWKIITEDEADLFFSAGLTRPSGVTYPSLQVSGTAWTGSFANLDDYAVTQSTFMAMTQARYQLHAMNKTSIDGNEAVLLDYEALRRVMPDPELKDKLFHSLVLFVRENDNLWTITGYTLSSLYEEQENDLRQVLSSFRVR